MKNLVKDFKCYLSGVDSDISFREAAEQYLVELDRLYLVSDLLFWAGLED